MNASTTTAICTTVGQVLSDKNHDSIKTILSAALNESQEELFKHIFSKINKDNEMIDSSVLTDSDKRFLEGVLKDKNIMQKLNIALREELEKTQFAGTSFTNMKMHIKALQQNKKFFYNGKDEIDASILIKVILGI